MQRDRTVQLVAGVFLAVGLVSSMVLSTVVTAASGKAQLGYHDRVNESDPPEVAIGIAMGAFRGLFVNILWMRAQNLKMEGKFHESIELSKTITRLQPRFPRVWGFHAWNLAYNISVATNTADERWLWVKAGLDLLRDEGIPKNPNDMLLHKEMAWIFVHKIQGSTDDAHLFYKRRLAREWQQVLGPPPPRVRAEALEEINTRRIELDLEPFEDHYKATQAAFAAQFERIVVAPDTLEELIELHPRAAELVERLPSECGLELGRDTLRAFEVQRALAFAYSPEGVTLHLRESEQNDAFVRLLNEMNDDPELADAWGDLVAHMRRRVLIDEYNMEPARMHRYMRMYGPMDWRHPAAQGLYWATRGVEEGLQRRNTEDFDLTNTDRVITHCMQELFRWGQIEFDILNDTYVQMVDLAWAPVYGRILTEELDARATEFEDTSRVFRLFSLGYQNFLHDVVRVYYRMGDYQQADDYYNQLRTYPYLNLNAPDFDFEKMSKPLKEFVELDVQERIHSPEFAQMELSSSLQNAFRNGLLMGDLTVFQSSMQYAAQVHDYFLTEQRARTRADTKTARMQPFSPFFYRAAADVLIGLFASGEVGLSQQALMYRRLQASNLADLSRATWDWLSTTRRDQIPNFDLYFPEPPGMEEFRLREAQIQGTDMKVRDEDLQMEVR